MQPRFDLSVILAEAKDNRDTELVIGAIERACTGLSVEVLVVRPPGGPALPTSTVVAIRELRAAEDSLVPERWGQGIRFAEAPVFGCLTTELTVTPEWARVLLQALSTGAVGAAGSIGLAPRPGLVAGAMYLVRFSAFLPGRAPKSRTMGDIPGDGAAYLREPVLAYPDLLSEGFWEAEFHRRFQAESKQLISVPETLVAFRSSLRLRSAIDLRRRHGQGYGATRVRRHGESASRVLFAAPAVPVVMIFRMLRRATRSPGMMWLAIRSLPVLAMLCAAWARGEATGAWAARSQR